MKIYTVIKHSGLLLITSWIFLLPGCGGGSGGEQLPPQSTVRIQPASINWDITPNGDPCVIDPAFYQDHLIAVTVANSAGNAIGKAKVTASLTLSANTFAGFPVLELYNDSNNNGVVDGPEERVSDLNDPLYETTTESRTGVTYMIIRVNVSCPYRGNLDIFSEGFFNSISIEVKTDEVEIQDDPGQNP